MGTRNFTRVDKILAFIRGSKIKPYISPGDKVLDIGCGYHAAFLNLIKHQVRLGIGIDYDCENKKISPKVEIKKFKFVNILPFKNNAFDKIILMAVVEHFYPAQLKKLFFEAKRVLNRQGQILLTTPTSLSKTVLEFLAFKMHLIVKEEIADHKKYYSEKDLREIAGNTGFRVKKYRTFFGGYNSFCQLVKEK